MCTAAVHVTDLRLLTHFGNNFCHVKSLIHLWSESWQMQTHDKLTSSLGQINEIFLKKCFTDECIVKYTQHVMYWTAFLVHSTLSKSIFSQKLVILCKISSYRCRPPLSLKWILGNYVRLLSIFFGFCVIALSLFAIRKTFNAIYALFMIWRQFAFRHLV